MPSTLISLWFMLHVKLEMAILNMFGVKKNKNNAMFSHMLRVCDYCSFLQLHQHFRFIAWVPLPPLFPFSPHWPVRQICRGHGGVPAVTFGRAAAHNTVHLLETSLRVLMAYQKANSVADTFACQRLFYHPTFTIMCRVGISRQQKV